MTPTEWSESVDPEPMLGLVLPSASDRKRRLYAVACCRQVEMWLVVDGGFLSRSQGDHSRRAVDAAEMFADGQATPEELREALRGAEASAFCDEDVEDMTAEERRMAHLGNDAGWPARLLAGLSARVRSQAAADPIAWLEADGGVCLPAGLDPFCDVALPDAVLVGETVGRQVLLLVRHFGGRQREARERAIQAALIRDVFGDPYPPPAFDPAWRTPEVVEIAEGVYDDKAFDRMPFLADALEGAGCTNEAILEWCRGPGPHARGCWVLDLALGKG